MRVPPSEAVLKYWRLREQRNQTEPRIDGGIMSALATLFDDLPRYRSAFVRLDWTGRIQWSRVMPTANLLGELLARPEPLGDDPRTLSDSDSALLVEQGSKLEFVVLADRRPQASPRRARTGQDEQPAENAVECVPGPARVLPDGVGVKHVPPRPIATEPHTPCDAPVFPAYGT